MPQMRIRRLEERDCPRITAAFAAQGWNKPLALYEKYLEEQKAGRRIVLVVVAGEDIAGYATLCWESDYLPFKQRRIPEITDLNVLKKYQRRGIGTLLLRAAEAAAAERSETVGIGVGLSADYGRAQRLYVKNGYLPDGRGISRHNRFPDHGERVPVDDDLILYLTKSLI